MPEEITSQSQARKRKERKKKGKDSLDRVGFKHEDDDEPIRGHKGAKDEVEEDESSEDIRDDGRHTSHGHGGGILSTTVFLILLGGLVLLTALIYIELKDSKSVGPTITDSRYASYLGEFVEEPEAEEEHLEHYDAPATHSDEDEDEEDTLHELHSTDNLPSSDVPETLSESVPGPSPVPHSVPDIVDETVENTQQQEEVVPELLTIKEEQETEESVVPDVVEDDSDEGARSEDEVSVFPTATEVIPETTEQPQIQVSETQSEPQITETPSEPQIPEIPSEPQVPETPSEPQVPETPSEPQVPEPPVPETPSEPQLTEAPFEPQVTVESSQEPHLEEEKSTEYDDQIENELKEAQQEMEKDSDSFFL